ERKSRNLKGFSEGTSKEQRYMDVHFAPHLADCLADEPAKLTFPTDRPEGGKHRSYGGRADDRFGRSWTVQRQQTDCSLFETATDAEGGSGRMVQAPARADEILQRSSGYSYHNSTGRAGLC